MSDSNSENKTLTINYILNDDEDGLYFGLYDKIEIPKLSRKKIYLDLEKILGKNNVRNIQGVRIKQDELLKEVYNLNKINRILIIIIIIIILVNIISIIKN